MTRKDNILQELKDLNSSLGNQVIPFTVPDGYFENLPESVLVRIRSEEEYNSEILNNLSRQMPFAVPAGYFDSLAERMLAIAKRDSQSVKEELENLSPLLSGLKKDMPFSVPQNYFNDLALPVRPKAKVVSLSGHKWFRYAAAAVVAGLIVTLGLVIGTNNNNPEKAIAKFEQKIEKEIEKAPDKELDEFLLQFSVAGMTGEEKAYTAPATGEVEAYLKDVSEDELKEFLDETAASESTLNNETLFLN